MPEHLIKYSYPNGLFRVLIHEGTKRSLKGKLELEPHQTGRCVLGGGCSFHRLPQMKSKTHAGWFQKKYLRNLWDPEQNYDPTGRESPGRKSKSSIGFRLACSICWAGQKEMCCNSWEVEHNYFKYKYSHMELQLADHSALMYNQHRSPASWLFNIQRKSSGKYESIHTKKDINCFWLGMGHITVITFRCARNVLQQAGNIRAAQLSFVRGCSRRAAHNASGKDTHVYCNQAAGYRKHQLEPSVNHGRESVTTTKKSCNKRNKTGRKERQQKCSRAVLWNMYTNMTFHGAEHF